MSAEISPSSLYQRALEAARNAYAPYSNFRVGAALLTSSGEVVTGCNVENASFRLTTCAEQNAITSAVALIGPGLQIDTIAVATLNNAPCQPCGACRQTLVEFAKPSTRILYTAADGSVTATTIAELLPASFRLSPEGRPQA